jgi:hypothetical protein
MRLLIALVLLVVTTPVYAQTLGSTSGASSVVDVSNPSSTTTRLITTPTIAAPGLAAAGIETCLGSTAGGLSLMGGGITFGSTRVDEGCTIRLLARQLYAFGFQKAALALMCQDPHVVLAMDEVGSPCPAFPAPVGVALSIVPMDRPSTAAAQASQATSYAPVTPGGYILDLEPGEASESVQASYGPAAVSQQEQAWFDRASDIN